MSQSSATGNVPSQEQGWVVVFSCYIRSFEYYINTSYSLFLYSSMAIIKTGMER